MYSSPEMAQREREKRYPMIIDHSLLPPKARMLIGIAAEYIGEERAIDRGQRSLCYPLTGVLDGWSLMRMDETEQGVYRLEHFLELGIWSAVDNERLAWGPAEMAIIRLRKALTDAT